MPVKPLAHLNIFNAETCRFTAVALVVLTTTYDTNNGSSFLNGRIALFVLSFDDTLIFI